MDCWERASLGWVVRSVVVACLVALPGVLWAQDESAEPGGIGLSVEPGGLLIQHVTPGETYDLARTAGISLKVSNRDTKPRTYQLSAHQPSSVGNGKWLEGYQEIPDASWFWFDRQELTVAPHSDGRANMYFKIPDGDRYYNQHWVVSIGVNGKPQPGEMLALAAYPRYQIETESKAGAEGVPAGDPGLKPSVLAFEGITLGAAHTASLALYNPGEAKRRYTLTAKTISAEDTREQIVPSAGYAWVPQPRWVTPGKRRVTIEGYRDLAVEVKVVVPNSPGFHGQRWEALLWIEPDEGRPRFARVQIETAEAAQPE